MKYLIIAIQPTPTAKKKDVSICFLQPGKDSFCAENRLASSIHTIYRPVARSRRHNISSARRTALVTGGLVVEEPGPGEPLESDEGEDFEDSSPEVATSGHNIALHSPSASHSYLRPPSSRTGSLNTIKLQRRVRLAEKLREVFELPDIEEVRAGMSVII
jgi:sterol 3beta-glucosyltransferase